MRRQYHTPNLVHSYLFPSPTPSDPPDFQQHLIRNLITEVRIETHRFYGGLETIEAKYPGLNYAHPPHRKRLARFPHHARLFEAFDALGLTPYEIGELCKWEGTLWARQRYERDEGVKVEDTTGSEIKPWKPRKELKTSGHKRSASGDIKGRIADPRDQIFDIRDYSPAQSYSYSYPQPRPRSPILHSHLHRDHRPRPQPAAIPQAPAWSIMIPDSRPVQQLTSSQEEQQQQATTSNVEQQTTPSTLVTVHAPPAESPPTPTPSTPTPQDQPHHQPLPRVVTQLPTPPHLADEPECIEEACQHKEDEMCPIIGDSSTLGVYVVADSMLSPIASSPPSLTEDDTSVSASP
jgi:hypothetical protein